ncbi:hypothetical protein IWW38_004901 [Coemansia aciculifera]|uniref:Uncharacterized protein n=1 Tax=Coemansia aciculifera TaxID=417176 RepID=A0ACC1LW92_9FUNG|nr:hypothetical protein IWW38_004901 [Coemansia aciculifera]
MSVPPDLLLGESSGMPGPSMSTEEGSGLSVGAVPAWLPDAELVATTVSLGWPVTAVATATATTAASSALGAATVPVFGQAEPTMTPFPQHNSQMSLSSSAAAAGGSSNSHVTTINALGVRELGGEGDFWLQPAPLLPPELDQLSGSNIHNGGGIGCLGEETDDSVDCIPELEEDLHCIYENSHTSLLLDYGRVTAPSRLG